jgi:hypothetical protein
VRSRCRSGLVSHRAVLIRGERMDQVASLAFRHVEAGSRAFASVRVAEEVCVTPKVARELAAALESAAQRAEAK